MELTSAALFILSTLLLVSTSYSDLSPSGGDMQQRGGEVDTSGDPESPGWRPAISWGRLGNQRGPGSQPHAQAHQPLLHGLPLDWLSEEESMSQDGPSRGARHLHTGDINTFQSVCQADRDLVTLNNEEFEYRPSYYHEVRCRHTTFPHLQKRNKVCSSVGFTCVQRNRTVYLTRRRFDSDCWESESRVIPSACECMWPTHALGDITRHH